MIYLKINAAKTKFFDRLAAVEQMIYAAGFQGAMLVRKIAQRSMRSGGKKGKSSEAGQPPRTHGRRLLREKLFAIFDSQTKSQVIGPALLNGKARRNRGKTVPETLEYGGSVDVDEYEKSGVWGRYPGMSAMEKRFLPKRTRAARIEPRPFMNPALEKAKPRLAEMFHNRLKRAA